MTTSAEAAARQTFDALAAGDRVEVILDGGIRRGSDVVKALALGANATLIGRPVLWGLACAGQAGVESVLSIIEEEVVRTLALCGLTRSRDVGPALVQRVG